MGLEVANYIPELVPSNPAGSDPVSSGDDHIRNLKVAIKNSFSGFVGSTATPKAVTLTEDQINDAALKAALNVFLANQTLSNAVKLLGRNAAANQSYRIAEIAAMVAN